MCKPQRKKPSTYGSTCVLPLLCHIQKSHFWSLLIPWLVGSSVSDVFTVRSANQCTAASIPVFIHLMLLSALGVHVGVPHMCLALRVCVFLQCFIAGRASICLSHVACNTRYLSPSNIYLLSIVHLRSVYILSICMRPEITSVMASHSAEISADVGNLSAWE